MNKFTPGPWGINSPYESEVQTADCKTIASCWYDGCEGAQVTIEGVTGCTPEESAANARLIAAAPELLDALEEVISNCLSSEGLSIAYEKARVAIAKARGEA